MKTLLKIPLADAANAATQGQANPPLRILVVEDDISVRQLNIEILARSGYEVDAAEDGAAAWESLNGDSYDLMITDNGMPRLTGIELLKKLRAARMELPVIMATGTLPTEEFARSPWLQPAATLVKPYTIEELLRTVKKVLRVTNAAREPIKPLPNCRSQRSGNGLPPG
jgi:DNA-binding response OmpR family regulator